MSLPGLDKRPVWLQWWSWCGSRRAIFRLLCKMSSDGGMDQSGRWWRDVQDVSGG